MSIARYSRRPVAGGRAELRLELVRRAVRLFGPTSCRFQVSSRPCCEVVAELCRSSNPARAAESERRGRLGLLAVTGATDRDGGGAGPGRWRRILARRSQALDSFAVAGRNPQLRLMLIARLATVTGRWASAVALAVYAYDAGGATYVGVLAVVRIVPSALAGGLAAALLDRVRTDRLLLVAGLARVVAIGAAGSPRCPGPTPPRCSRSSRSSRCSRRWPGPSRRRRSRFSPACRAS